MKFGATAEMSHHRMHYEADAPLTSDETRRRQNRATPVPVSIGNSNTRL
jgi:hypothetical protein